MTHVCNPDFQEAKVRAEEMAQWLRALATLLEDLGSIPNSDMAAHNSL